MATHSRICKNTAWQHTTAKQQKQKVDLPWFLPQDITCISEPLARQSKFLVLRFSSILLASEIRGSCDEDHGKRIFRTTEFNLANHAI